jgi:hypothetical protein
MNTAQEVSTLGAKAGFDIADIRQVNSSAATIMLGPLVLVELLALRILARPAFAGRRSNIIAILEKRP